MGDADPSLSSGSSCSTPSNNNHQPCPSSCASDVCRPCPTEICRPHSSFEHQIPKLEPLQQPRTPPTPPASSDEAAVCAGCGMKIADRYYLQAVDRRWHAACLQCCQCRNTLDGEITCFSRDGNIYCKKDYYRLVEFVFFGFWYFEEIYVIFVWRCWFFFVSCGDLDYLR